MPQEWYYSIYESLPVRGAWVEIVRDIVLSYVLCGRSPCGERGLKCDNAISSKQ